MLALTAALDSATKIKTDAASTSTGQEIAVSLNPAYRPVRLTDLVNFDGEATVTEDFGRSGDHLADFCGGGTWERSVSDWSDVSGLTEERVAAGLGIGTDQLCDVALRLWNTTFSAERDRLAGPNGDPQRKGRVTRRLKAELEKAIADGNS